MRVYVEGWSRVQYAYRFEYKMSVGKTGSYRQGAGRDKVGVTQGQLKGHENQSGTRNLTNMSMMLHGFTGEAEFFCQIGFTKREVADLFVTTFGTSTLNTAIKELTAAQLRAAPPQSKSRGMKYGI